MENKNGVCFEGIYEIFKSKNLPHALIIQCEDLLFAYENIKKSLPLLFCKSDGNLPCSVCSSCIKISKEIHPEIKVLSLLKDSKNIKIDQVRKVRQDAYVASSEGKYKIYIFNPAEAMNIQAQNALIKILEEPPKNVVFILLCKSSELLLDTVLSRCEIFRYQNINQNSSDLDLKSYAKNILELISQKKRVEILKILSKFSLDRQALKNLVYYIIGEFVEGIKDSYKSKVEVEFILERSDKLKLAIDFIDRNVNINLILTYICSVL